MAKFDVTKIEGFEDLTTEEKLAKLLEQDLPDVSEIEKERDKFKGAFDKTSKDLADLKKANKQREEESSSALSESDKRLKELEGKYNTLIREKNIAEAKAKFTALGFDDKSATDTATQLIDGETDSLFESIGKFVSDTKNNLKKELLKSTPKPAETGKADDEKKTSLEKFRAMSLLDKQKLAKNDPDEYRRLTSGE